ncbi:GvpL/GvpF family gas vesicle protein [Actinopolymorpha singaporensis]|uniref:Gas vesicle synthesis protein GvpL/GvpF n=1 Tax=Actinopolymorpha singaporensis TaxID=117157 RepID=A0A1H1TH66_9ACTN|nr:GvpL/GvpF family gas vesicle protein [Actinopolymorpha singaporensis]SDS59572.1 Gas vesicle synthesis protein GvpL/GvpF [Actinopolymorpha singaporensis]
MSAAARNLLADRPTPDEVTSLVDEASERARALVRDELVDQLAERYRQAVRSVLGVEPFPPEEPTAGFEPGLVPRARPAPTDLQPSVEGQAPVEGQGPTEGQVGAEGGAPAEGEAPAETAWYVYAILRRVDLPAGRSLPAPAELPAGVEGASVELLDAGDLAVAASEVPLAGFRASDQDPDLSAHGWLRAAVAAHERVVEDLARDRTVLPFRFGALYPSSDDARKIALTDAGRLAAELDRLDGASEWGVKAYVESPADRAEQVPAYLDEPATGTTWMVRRREAAAAREAAGRLRGAVAAALEDALAGQARDVVVRASARVGPSTGQTTGHSTGHSTGQTAGRTDLAFDAVYLVSHPRQDEFDANLRDVARQYADDGLRVEVSGPWPPYHFVRMPTDTSRSRASSSPTTGAPR